MTTINKEQRDAENYARKVVEEVSALSDAEVLAIAAEDYRDPKKAAADVREFLLAKAAEHGKARLRAAQVRVAEEDAIAARGNVVPLSFEAKRAKFARIVARHPELTMAARQGQVMDETELDGYLADLAELGISDETDKE